MSDSLSNLSHFDAQGQAHMVDVGQKTDSQRVAHATGHIRMNDAAFACVVSDSAEKGDVLGVARIAAIQAAKNIVHIDVIAETYGKTGVEMEALTSVSVGLLTIYDMLKAVDKSMQMDGICLVRKEGGKSGIFVNPNAAPRDE